MSSIFQPADTVPLDVDLVVETLEHSLHSIGFVNETYEQIYAVKVEVLQFPEITMTMSDGSVFKLTVEEVK